MRVLYDWTSWIDIKLLDIMTELRIGALRHLVERRHLHVMPTRSPERGCRVFPGLDVAACLLHHREPLP
jgi:hypothetical protein